MAGPLPDAETLEQLDGIQLEVRAREVRRINVEVVLRLYVVMGLLVAVIALGYFGFSFLKINLTEDQRMALVAAGSGFSVAAMSWTYLAIRGQQRASRIEDYQTATLDYDLIKEWSKFEAVGRLVLERKGIEFNPRSPRSILSTLEKNEVIPNDLARDISTALDIRNKVVHQVEPQPHILVQAAGRLLADCNEKLNRILLSSADSAVFSAGTVAVSNGPGNTVGSVAPRGVFAGGGDAKPVDPAGKRRWLDLED